jgi:hypothetical protein
LVRCQTNHVLFQRKLRFRFVALLGSVAPAAQLDMVWCFLLVLVWCECDMVWSGAEAACLNHYAVGVLQMLVSSWCGQWRQPADWTQRTASRGCSHWGICLSLSMGRPTPYARLHVNKISRVVLDTNIFIVLSLGRLQVHYRTIASNLDSSFLRACLLCFAKTRVCRGPIDQRLQSRQCHVY